jgi:hypothetical protein
MFIPEPGSLFLSIPDPKTAIKERGETNFVVLPCFAATNITKLKIILFFKLVKKKIWANLQRVIELLPKKLSLSSQTYRFGIRDPRSGIRKKTYSGSLIQGQTGTGTATLLEMLKKITCIVRSIFKIAGVVISDTLRFKTCFKDI